MRSSIVRFDKLGAAVATLLLRQCRPVGAAVDSAQSRRIESRSATTANSNDALTGPRVGKFAPTSAEATSPNITMVGVLEGASTANADNKQAYAKMHVIQHYNKRALSTLTIDNNVEQSTPRTKSQIQLAMLSKEELRDFMAVFPDIVRDLTDEGRDTDIPEVFKWYAKVLQFNVANGKKTRGLTTVAAYKMFVEPELQTPENIRLANIMGWLIEMAMFLVVDDIMDNSETRRGVPCWYKLPGVGLSGINDALLLENGIYFMLKKHFANHPCYVPALELFHDYTTKTVMGQSLDMMCMKDGKPTLETFTMSRYNSIAKYKTAYYSFQLPVALAMVMAGKIETEMHREAKNILMEMGHFYQVQNDFLDCFGNPEVTGKVGTDIRDGKCSWLVVVALQRASPAQRKILEENYGRGDDYEAERKVRALYEELALPNAYSIYEEEYHRSHIQQLNKGVAHEMLLKSINRIYNLN